MEELKRKANEILHLYGYHSGNCIDYDNVVEILIDVLKDENEN